MRDLSLMSIFCVLQKDGDITKVQDNRKKEW